MDIDEIAVLCKQYPSVDSDFPFGLQPECYRVGGKIFAEVYSHGVPGALRILLNDEGVSREDVVPMVTLRCEPAWGDMLRQQFPGIVLRPYHCPPVQQPYANTVLVDGRIPVDIMEQMIKHAYAYVFSKLPKKQQLEIQTKQST